MKRAATQKTNWKTVKSENLWKVAYEKDAKELWVIFVARKMVVYKYRNVSLGLYQGLVTAPSVGKYFLEKIKPGRQFVTEGMGRGTPLK